MELINSNFLTLTFQTDLNARVNQIEEKELKIISALSDLFIDPPSEQNFINESLKYLKINYGLTKSVWLVLLRLSDSVPKFIDILLNWEIPIYKYTKLWTLNNKIGNQPLSENNREYCIRNLFHFIDLLSKNFNIETVCDSLGILIKEFDTKKSQFSIINLFKFRETLENYNDLSSSKIYCLSYRFNRNLLYWTLNKLYYISLDKLDPHVNKINLTNSLKFLFENMEIMVSNEIEFFEQILTTYKKYTQQPFITYNGLIEIKEKIIENTDKKIIDLLLKEFDKTEKYNKANNQITVELIRLTQNYNNNIINCMNKMETLLDYISRSKDIREKILTENNFSLKNLLIWSNQWHLTGDAKGEKKDFKVYDIDINISNYVFEQLKDSHQLHEEGRVQSHCVYSYTKDCLEGKNIIVSMKDSSGKRISTLCFTKDNNKFSFFKKKKIIWVLNQNRKRFNQNCSPEENKIAQQYFNLIKEKISKN